MRLFKFTLLGVFGLLSVYNHTWAQLPTFDSQAPPKVPNYFNEKYWSALPNRVDAADVIPKSESWVEDTLKQVDVFYVHPTMYRKGKTWNADVDDEKMNKKVDDKPVHYQASVFNRSCRVYAPRYRQATVEVFYEETEDGEKALELAYADVKRAFEYYLKNYNQGRPIIIASHSQGTRHCRKLLKEYFDGTRLQSKLVAAYVIGFEVNPDRYEQLPVCSTANQTGCYVSWLSYKKSFEPDGEFHKKSLSVNPLTWTLDTAWAGKENNLGTVILNLNKRRQHATDAKIHYHQGNILWVKTKAPFLRSMKNLHIADYNLFWYDIRQNVKDRISAYWK